MADELKDQRIPIMMTPSEVKALDDWMFDHRIRSRGEAIRRLCQIGMLGERRFNRMAEMFRRLDVVHQDLRKTHRAAVDESGPDSLQVRIADGELKLSYGLQVRGFIAQMTAMQVMLHAIMSKETGDKSVELLKQTEEYIDKMNLADDKDPRFALFVEALGGNDAAMKQLAKLDEPPPADE